jgi:hypothetical protein
VRMYSVSEATMKINPAGLKKFNEEQARLQSLVDADPNRRQNRRDQDSG